MHVKASQPSAALVAVVQPRPMWLQVGNAVAAVADGVGDGDVPDCDCVAGNGTVCMCVCCCMMCLSVVRGMQNMCESNVIKMLKRRDAMPKSKQKTAATATTATGTTR